MTEKFNVPESDFYLSQSQIDELSKITNKDVDNAVRSASPDLKEFLNAQPIHTADKNYTLGK